MLSELWLWRGQVFAEFDLDGSGFLDYDEFSKMLPALGIYLPPPKLVRITSHVYLRFLGGADGVPALRPSISSRLTGARLPSLHCAPLCRSCCCALWNLLLKVHLCHDGNA
jgi:hypothetical protein